MPWATVYIRGRAGFQSAVLAKLEGTWLRGSPEAKDDLIMFWLPDTVSLRNLKIAIGSRVVFKYRLQFVTDLNNHLKLEKRPSASFSISENEMVDKMVRWDNVQREQRTQSGT